MLVIEILESFVDTFADSPSSLQASFFLTFLCLLLQAASLGTSRWLDLKGESDDTLGLWKHCWKENEYACCETIETHIFDVQGSMPEWFHTARTLQNMALATAVVSLILIPFSIGVTTQPLKSVLLKINVLVNEITGLFILSSIILYGSQYRYEKWLNDAYLSASFGLSTTAGVIFIFTGILLAVGGRYRRVENADSSSTVNRIQIQPTAQQTHPGDFTAPSAPPMPHTMRTSRTTNQLTSNDANTCEICMDRLVETVFIPCGHSRCCVPCAETIQSATRRCPFCRGYIRNWNRIYR